MLTMRPYALILAVLLSVCVGLAGCSGDDRDAAPGALTAALAETRPATPELIKMLADVAAVRGLPPPATIRFGTVKRDALPELLDSLLTADDRKGFATTTTLYRLLGHLRPDHDYLSVYLALASQSAIGLFSPTYDTLWIVDDRPASEFALEGLSPDGSAALAHELVHAVQDANFRLEDLRHALADGVDASLALAAVLEGDAVTHQSVYAARIPSVQPIRPSATADSRPPANDVPPSVARELLFPYTTGAAWLAAVRESGGTEAVDSLVLNPPRTSAAILHPELGKRWTPVPVTLPDLSQALGDGWQRESGGTFGEFQLRNYLQLRLPGIPAATAATGWHGDRYDVYTRGNESVAALRIAFADATEANEFASAQETFLATGGARRSLPNGLTTANSANGTATVVFPTAGREVTFIIGSSEAIATRLAALLIGG